MSRKDTEKTSLLIDHFRNQRCRGTVDTPDLQHEVVNRRCGDRLSFSARLKNDRVDELKFEGEGCFYCLASASIACSELSGMQLPDAVRKTAQIRAWLGGDERQAPDSLEAELTSLGEIKAYPMRIGCVDLAWKGLETLLASGTEDGSGS
ncbi:iron-sulfur cluster assembly scaffold protein [Natronogracilivirga saccharolytica]|uniref:Iron-sulfur cluster assembly scaffold protein n=1 Tax=Natronogracilivirga saccharolytica TaxID=2812953 RepID=A0A8J7RK68_9BACT|nr:iron-sulfur cluster assembly scaffold protein [Natronogracilivirga saccharolytica]MBP3192742.1 iron-sulfur cluster assembly scaffold protein [Natronogracilivirga saccharolytica]